MKNQYFADINDFRKYGCEFFQIPQVFALTTANVLFLLMPQPHHQHYLAQKCNEISANWGPQIIVKEFLWSN
jgi:hypothetical protein